MKGILAVVVALVLVCNLASAQKSIYRKGQNVAQVGIGIGGIGGFYGTSSLPVISAGVEFGIHEFVSVGGILGYSTSKYEYPFIFVGQKGVYSYKYSYITIAGRGSYHLPLDIQNTDLYAGVGLGYTIVSSKVDGKTPSGLVIAGASGSYFFFGVHAGGRYYFSQSVAGYAELGYGFGILNVGVAFRI